MQSLTTYEINDQVIITETGHQAVIVDKGKGEFTGMYAVNLVDGTRVKVSGHQLEPARGSLRIKPWRGYELNDQVIVKETRQRGVIVKRGAGEFTGMYTVQFSDGTQVKLSNSGPGGTTRLEPA